jgi:tetratricopeptide (TPR) repeat protein
MGRFSKLETAGQDAVTARQSEAAAGRRSPPEAAAEEGEPDYGYAYYAAEADKQFYSGDARRALQLYSRAIQADAAQVAPWLGQILCLLELRQPREAMVWVRRALELFPEDPRLVSARGAVYAHLGMVQQAIGCSDFALNISGRDPLVWVLRGEILTIADNRNASICFEKAMEARPHGDWQIPMLIGLACLRQKRWAPAAEYLKRATEQFQGNDHLWERLGHAQEHLGLVQAALESYRAATHINPHNAAAEDAIRRLTRTPFIVRWLRRLVK